LDAARELSDQMIARFWDSDSGGLFFVGAESELIVRSKSARDSALPSGNAVATHALLDLAELTGDLAYRDRAAQVLHAFGGGMRAQPSVSVHLAAAAERYLHSSAPGGSGPGIATVGMEVDSLVEMRIALPSRQPAAGEVFSLVVHLDIRDGWHINANPASSDLLIPTSLILNADIPLALAEVRYPAGQAFVFPALEETLSVYQGQVAFWADVSPDEKAAGAEGDLRLLVQYQACDEARCLPPAELSQSVRLTVME